MPSNELFMTNNLFIFPSTVHGKDLAEEIKSETSGDLQSTLTKLVEVGCVLLYTKTCWFHLFNVSLLFSTFSIALCLTSPLEFSFLAPLSIIFFFC